MVSFETKPELVQEDAQCVEEPRTKLGPKLGPQWSSVGIKSESSCSL